jgi:NADPH:quinone reductase-like Zn-dependent oxidoreductase
MSLPKICAAFRRTTGALPNTIEPYREELSTETGIHEVIIKIRAVSLNYRDVAMLCGEYPVPPKDGGIPCSDASAEVIAIGSAVKAFTVGDRVAPITTTGKYEDTNDGISEGPGVNVHGFLRKYAKCQEKHHVHLPKGVSWEEASSALYILFYKNDTHSIRHQCYPVPALQPGMLSTG